MKSNLVSSLTALALTLGTTLVASQPSQAQSRQFFCGLSYGYPTTIVRTPIGNKPIIVWTENSWISDTLTPRRRCQEISNRFQDLYDKGQLGTAKAGRVNGQPVICGVANAQGSCNSSNVLVTLTRDQNPNKIATQLLNTRASASGQPVYLSGKQEGWIEPQIGSDGFVFFDMDTIVGDHSEPNW
jgi:Circadian oscillating protein COP23